MPANARAVLGRTIEALRPGLGAASIPPVENLHCTLAFLGNVDDDRVDEIARACSAAIEGSVDFPTSLDSLGAFPSVKRARVVWAGLADPAGGIATVAAAVREGLEAIGFPSEKRPFRAHVTLARLRAPHRVTLDAELEPVRFAVDKVTLFQSLLRGAKHPVYESVATFPFHRELRAPRPD